MDGVIADTALEHYRSWQYAFNLRRVNFTEEDFQHCFGQRNDAIIRQMLGKTVEDSVIEAIARDKEEYFRSHVAEHLKPFPGVIRLLRLLKEQAILSAIGSSAPLENIELILKGLHIEEYFQAIVYGQEVTEGKPDPQIYLLAARKLGADPRNCIVIEDAVAGVQAAKRAGMKCIAVTNTHPEPSLREADVVTDSLEKINLKEIEKLLGSASRKINLSQKI